MNDNKNKIIREEFARAIMIKKAQSVLSESAFRGFMSEMRKYEQNMIITEGMSSENVYDGFQKQLMEATATAEREVIADTQGTTQKTASTEVEPGGAPNDDKKEGGKDNKGSSGSGKFPDNLSPASKQKLDALGITDPIKMAKYILKNPDNFDPNDDVEADAFIRSETARVTGSDPGSSFEAPEEPTGNVKKDTENLGKELKSPKAKGILSSIFNSYKFAFAANASMWEKIYDFINGIGNKPPAEQEKAVQTAEDQLTTAMPDPPETPEEAEEQAEDGDGEGDGDQSINIRKGKNSLQSRLAKLFPDLAKAKGTYYYRKTDKPGDQGRIISKNTSALAAILGDIEAQLKGSDIAITESQLLHLGETMLMFSQGQLLTEAKLSSFKGKIRQVLQRVRDSEEDPKKRKKKIDKFLYRLRAYAEKGDMDKFASRYKDIKGANSIASQYGTLSPEDQQKGVDYAKSYAQNQFMGDEDSVRGKAKGEAPASKSKEQMAKQVPKIKNGVINIAQIIGPKLKAAGYDLKSPEGQKVQQRLLKVLRRFLKKDLERLGLSSKVKLLAMFSKSKPKKGKVNESMQSLEESYLDFFSNYMLEGIINELQNQ
jgi:hypothetical protein